MSVGRQWIRKFLTRTVISYCLFAALLTGIIGAYLINRSNQLLTEEVTKENETRLANIREFVEQMYLKTFEFSSLGKLMPTMQTGPA